MQNYCCPACARRVSSLRSSSATAGRTPCRHTGSCCGFRRGPSCRVSRAHPVRFLCFTGRIGASFKSSSAAATAGSSCPVCVRFARTAAGTAGSYSQISIDQYTPRTLAYQCLNHPYMGNSFNTNTNAGGRMKGTSTGIAIDGNIEATIDGGTY